MIGQPQSHGRRALSVATHAIFTRESQCSMRPMEGVVEKLQADERIEGGIPLGEGVCLTGQAIEPIASGSVESFDMHGARWLHQSPQRGARLH
jgi:hypothetical protein